MANYAIRTVTQVLENITFRAEIGCDTVVLSDFSKLLAIPLRDGCDLMDVIGRRLRAQAAERMKKGALLGRPFYVASNRYPCHTAGALVTGTRC